jgi:hypothetical protein
LVERSVTERRRPRGFHAGGAPAPAPTPLTPCFQSTREAPVMM